VSITDKGLGIKEKGSNLKLFNAFCSSSASESRDPTYHYSRMFGASYSGAGIGLVKSKVTIIKYCFFFTQYCFNILFYKVYLNFHNATIDIIDSDGATANVMFDYM
jgi:hypothetical protein